MHYVVVALLTLVINTDTLGSESGSESAVVVAAYEKASALGAAGGGDFIIRPLLDTSKVNAGKRGQPPARSKSPRSSVCEPGG